MGDAPKPRWEPIRKGNPRNPLRDELETLESIAGQTEIMNTDQSADRADEEPDGES